MNLRCCLPIAAVLVAILMSAPALAAESALYGRGTLDLEQDGRTATLQVELAETLEAQLHGLMERDRLPENAGMLFLYREARRREFWMKDTRIPLSIAFIGSDGRIHEIADLDPPRPGGGIPAHRSREPARYVLEVNQGWFARHGFGVGALVRLRETP